MVICSSIGYYIIGSAFASLPTERPEGDVYIIDLFWVPVFKEGCCFQCWKHSYKDLFCKGPVNISTKKKWTFISVGTGPLNVSVHGPGQSWMQKAYLK